MPSLAMWLLSLALGMFYSLLPRARALKASTLRYYCGPSLWALLKRVPRVHDVVAMAETTAVHTSQLHGRRRQGCLSSLVGIYGKAQELGLVRLKDEIDVQLLFSWPSAPNGAGPFSLAGRLLYDS
eukprot:5617973-Amphidinium_carterae.1